MGNLEGERQAGVAIVQLALEEPMRQIAMNAGVESATKVHRSETDTPVDIQRTSQHDILQHAGVFRVSPIGIVRIAPELSFL